MRTSVIILNYNGRRWLRRCVSAVLQQEGAFELLVVDNASSDGSVEEIRTLPRVNVIQLPDNSGFAVGNNRGAEAARGTDFLVFLNNDTEVQPGWLEALTHALDERPDAGLATSHITYLDDPNVIDSAGDGYLRAGGAFKRWHGQRRLPGPGIEDVFGACGAAFAIRRPVFERLGGFDDDLFMVYEDVDLSYRAQLAGWRCVYVPQAVVRHAGGATLGRESRSAVFYGQRNLEWVWLKNTPRAWLWRDALPHVAYTIAGCAYYSAHGHAATCLRAKMTALGRAGAIWRKRNELRPRASVRVRGLMTRRWWAVKRDERRGEEGR
jgi:GT2 family glycosyltransferase